MFMTGMVTNPFYFVVRTILFRASTLQDARGRTVKRMGLFNLKAEDKERQSMSVCAWPHRESRKISERWELQAVCFTKF